MKIECLIDGCDADPSEELRLDEGGLGVAYAICRAHAEEVRSGAMFAQGADPSRGLLGLRDV
ncbi:hypothetical protein B7R21_11665 [Subtercola boreus]|uniref:Uncharacterized protein n=1 Tax=Subtercola boreus TaxID=120213 RepID=A0A3E0VPP4_9MICO|nr:hypothetical protein [Subtercola boreus]RFA11984.1 hypothetical protein B7R21_11665 [Subtercola boreus]